MGGAVLMRPPSLLQANKQGLLGNEHERKKGRVPAKHAVDWSDRLKHNEKTIFLQGKNLGMGADRFVSGPLKGIRPNYGEAEWNLIAQSLLKYVEDGEQKWKTGDSMEQLPTEYDPETKKTTGEILLTYLITKHYPYLADKYDTAFSEYYDEDLLAQMLDEVPASADDPPKPTVPGRVVHFGQDEDTGS